MLGLVERSIGSGEPWRAAHPALVEFGDAEAGGDLERRIMIDRVRADRPAEPPRHDRGLLGTRLGKEQAEFLAAQPAQRIVGPRLIGAQFGEPADHQVADGVAVAVVDPLEVIDVEDQQRRGAPVAPEQADRLVDLDDEGAAGQRAAQRIALGDAAQLDCSTTSPARSRNISIWAGSKLRARTSIAHSVPIL